ncbi:GntR family transcriptional regulator [Permianibacter aggregans]|nr:GntR family transcriptional regulator [Permianibacter aggregans]
MLQLSAADPRPLGKQITDGIRLQIASGELPVGSQLPSVRGLAQQLTINPNTVAKAYTELTNEGWLDARQGLGLFVAEPRQLLSDSERERRLSLAVDSFTAEVVGLGYPLETVLARLESTLAPCLKRRA